MRFEACCWTRILASGRSWNGTLWKRGGRERKRLIHEDITVLSIELTGKEFPPCSPTRECDMLLNRELWGQAQQLEGSRGPII